MSKNVFDHLRAWDAARQSPPPGRGRRRSVLRWYARSAARAEGDAIAAIAGYREARPAVKDNPLSDLEQKWAPEPRIEAAPERIPCTVVELEDSDEAVCSMLAGGYELPRVRFPARVLRAKKLSVGSRFLWIVRDSVNVRPEDIDVNTPQADRRTPEEEAERERLFKKFEARVAEDGGIWPVYTGDGK
ncbi:MAG: hypothetical protein ACRC33_24565 [Gemmataceae bacterium]